jgi:hypothetical protein
MSQAVKTPIEWKWSNGSFNERSIRNKDETIPSSIPCNKREEHNEKINQRLLVTTASINPFMANNNYIKDLETQGNFLIPQNSNF